MNVSHKFTRQLRSYNLKLVKTMGILVKMAKRLTMLMVAVTAVEAQNLARGKTSKASTPVTSKDSFFCFDGSFNND